MFKLEIMNHWIVPQQGKNHSEIDEEPKNILTPEKQRSRRPPSGRIFGRSLVMYGREAQTQTPVSGQSIVRGWLLQTCVSGHCHVYTHAFGHSVGHY
jgi:hypothetical protein